MYLCMYISCIIQSDLDHSLNSKSRANPKHNDSGNKLMHKPVTSDQRPVLKKSLSHKDLKSYDGYSVSAIAVWILLLNLYLFISM